MSRRQRRCTWHIEVEVSQSASTTAVRQQWEQQIAVACSSSSSLSPSSSPTHPFTWFQQPSSNNPHATTAAATKTTTTAGEINLNMLPEILKHTCRSVVIQNDDGDKASCNDDDDTTSSSTNTNIQVHTFHLNDEEACTEELDPASGGGGDDEWTAGCDNLTLPHRSLHGMWENLIFDRSLKRQILDYASAALLFADRNVSSHIVFWNRILLMYGPPGTGKTSLCRALAHKLSIRLGHRFPRSCLLEIHCHSLFSKWFSTSGKLVSALFTLVRDMVEDDPTTLVFVLVDEVESLASTRGGCGTNGDPADATRAVNALLTSLDRLRRFPNVMVLTTTNLTSSVDGAFLDRVDLKVHIGNPNFEAREMILRSAVEELKRVGIVVTDIDFERRRVMDHDIFHEEHKEEDSNISRDLSKTEDSETSLLSSCAFLAEGLSGRALRRLPLQAFSQFLGGVECPVSSTEFLNALSSAIRAELHAREGL